ncbi:cytochrome P450 71A9-like [Typha latifolia]|uniref:cytochrome P450 71A9-like n=1 Tax=Typha latifolia TaxID=4733 RepID=UPI003C2BAF7C
MSSLLLISFLFVFVFLLIRISKSRNPNKLPPSPPSLPLIGHLHLLSGLPHRALLRLSRLHGPFLLLRLPQPTLLLSSAAAARRLFASHDIAFSSRPFSSTAAKLTYNSRNVSFSPYGDYWHHARKITVSRLLAPSRVAAFRSVRSDEVAALLGRICAAAGGGEPINLSEELFAYANRVVSISAAGKREGMAEEFREMMAEELAILSGFHLEEAYPALGKILGKLSGRDGKVEAIARKWDGFISTILEEHEEKARKKEKQSEEEDFVDVLLAIRRDLTAEIQLSEDDVKSILLDIIAAATVTTYVTIEWTMAELIRSPRIMKKVQNEIAEIGAGKVTIAEDDTNQANYLKAVIKEALRLHPPGPLLLPRESTTNVSFQGYEIPARTQLIINAWAIGRDPETWEEAEEFKPERFVGSPIDFRGNDFEFIPFGVGRRMCPGIQYAMATIELALANLLHHFSWALPDGMGVEDFDMEEAAGLTTTKKIPLHLVAIPQSNSL